MTNAIKSEPKQSPVNHKSVKAAQLIEAVIVPVQAHRAEKIREAVC